MDIFNGFADNLIPQQESHRELRFIELHEDSVINGMTVPAYTRLPVFTKTDLKRGAIETDVNSIILGLAQAVRLNLKNEDIDFYKRILLNDSTIVDRLIAQTQKINENSSIDDIRKNYQAIQLLRCLQETEISFINQVRALISMIHNELDDEGAIEDMEDELFELLTSGLEIYPDSYSLLFHMADYHKNMGNFENAEKYVERLESCGYKNENIEKLKSEIEYYSQKHDKILYIYDLINMNRVDDAIKSCLDFIKDDPKEWHVLFLLGWSYRLKEDYRKAEETLLKSIKYGGGDFAENFNELSLASWNLGKKDLAVQYAEMAYDFGNSVVFACNIAMMDLEIKDYESAYKYLCEAWLCDKDDELLHDLIKKYENEAGEKFVYPKMTKTKDKEKHKHCHEHKG